MSAIYMHNIERVFLQEELRKRRCKNRISEKEDLKMWFYKDLLSSSFSNDIRVFDRIDKRREALHKHGYFENGEITEKGMDKLVTYIITQIRSGKIDQP